MVKNYKEFIDEAYRGNPAAEGIAAAKADDKAREGILVAKAVKELEHLRDITSRAILDYGNTMKHREMSGIKDMADFNKKKKYFETVKKDAEAKLKAFWDRGGKWDNYK